MRTLLSIIASVSILVCAGCASDSDGSSRSPWAAGATKSTAAPKAPVAESAPARSADSAEGDVESVVSAAPAEEEGASLLAAYPAIREANKQKALAEIEAAKSDSQPLPVPDEGKARVVAYNVDCSVIQFDTATAFKVGEKVVLSKAGAHALVNVLVVSEGGRYVAEEIDGVVGAPMLVPGDEIDCAVWVDPEDIAAVAAAAEKAKQNSDDALAAVDDEEEYSEEEEYTEEEVEEEE